MTIDREDSEARSHDAVLHAGPAGQNDARGAVTHGHGRIETFAHLAERRQHTLITALFQHAADKIGSFASLAEERFFRQIDRHPLRACRDHGSDVGDQHFPRLREGGRYFGDDQLSVADVLNDLMHVVCP